MTKKEEFKLHHLIKIIKTNPIKMFCDFQNECTFLYDEINIEADTINFINDYFCFYDVDVKRFYHEFRNTLRLILPRYYVMLRTEINNDITKIYNNIKFKRVCIATSDDAIQNKLNKNNKTIDFNENYNFSNQANENGSNTGSSTNRKTINSETDTNDKTASKENPLSNEANGFNDLFEWETSTSVNETNNNEVTDTTENNNQNTTQTNTITRNSTDTSERNYTEEDNTKAHEDLRKIAKGLKDNEEITSEINNLIVENVNTIVSYLFKNNKASDYLINNLKKCFIGVYYYN